MEIAIEEKKKEIKNIVYEDKRHKVFEVYLNGERYEIFFVETSYRMNGSLAVLVMSIKDDEIDAFSTLTANLSSPMQTESLAFIDSNNNTDWGWEEILRDNGIAKDTGVRQNSGYCVYPLYKFDLSKLYENE